MTTQARRSRKVETRDKETRPQQWQPANMLPEPAPRDGVAFRWVRKSLKGTFDPTNFSQKQREGWVPCRLKDYPEMVGLVDVGSDGHGVIELGGLVLCAMPQEMVEQRKAYYAKSTANQMDAVDNNMMREEDPRMPLYKERKTKVEFGRGPT